MTDLTPEHLTAGSPQSLANIVDCIKQTGGAVEVQGVRIEPCDERGETATTRNVTGLLESLGEMEGKYLRALSLIHHLMRSRRRWQGEAFEHQFTYSLENTERVDTQQQLDAAHARIAELERAESVTLDIANRNITAYALVRSDLDTARRWAAWFSAEAAYWKTEADLARTVAAQNYESDGITVAALDAERTELQARVAELEEQVGTWQGMYRVASDHREQNLNDYRQARDECDAALARIAELEAPPTNPHAYIAVKRYHAVSADGPEWCDDAAVIPAGHIHAWEREDHQRRGYQLLPIVADGDGTRFAATPPTRCQATTASPLIGDRRSLWCELPAGHAGMHHAAVPQPGFPATEVDWDEAEEADRG